MAYSDSEESSYNSYDDDDDGRSEDYFSSVDDDAVDACSDDDDDAMDESCCESDDGECGDVVSDDDDETMPQAAAERNDKGYVFETMADVRKRQDEVTARVSELLSIPWGLAAVFLRHCRWDPERLENEWFSDERRLREAVGLTADAAAAAAAAVVSDRPLTCAICFDVHGAGETVSAGCAHFYCRACWRGYIHAAVGDGARCLLLRCPDPRCGAPVARELVREVAAAGDDDDDTARYETFVVRSFVEEGTSKRVRWCPGPGCTLAVRALPGSAPYEVACTCGHAFCFRCGEEAHRPASCEATRAWVSRTSRDGANADWVLAHTKHCPRCRRAIEKNQGCNHMRCGPPCRHEFCWICLGAWKEHGGDFYRCNRYVPPAPKANEERRRAHAMASLDRYVHFYERWAAHDASMRKARQDLERLEGGEALRGFAEANGVSRAELGRLEEAYALIVEARRAVSWTYPLVYCMDPERDGKKFTLCEVMQSVAEGKLEALHRCVETEWAELKATGAAPGAQYDAAAAAEFAAEFKRYMAKLFGLTTAMRNYFKALVEGFESGMPECKVLVRRASSPPACPSSMETTTSVTD